MDDLENNSVFDEVDMTRVSTGAATKVPLAQLNNRFARSVMLDYTDEAGDPQQIDLLATVPNLRWPWVGNEALDGSGLFIVHRERIKDAVTAVLNDLDFTPINMSTTVEFFHPDSQPADPSWYNSLIFEGTSFSLDADEENSLTSTLWSRTIASRPRRPPRCRRPRGLPRCARSSRRPRPRSTRSRGPGAPTSPGCCAARPGCCWRPTWASAASTSSSTTRSTRT